MNFYGIDVHSDSMTVAVKENTGTPTEPRIFHSPLSGPRFSAFLDRLKQDDLILIEATTLSFWFVDQVAERVATCHVLNTNRLAKQGNKTDKIDALRLVNILAYNQISVADPEHWPYIYIPRKEVRELRALFSTYTLTKKMITQTMNRLHSLYKQNGVSLDRKKLSGKGFREQLPETIPLAAMWMVQVCSLLNTLESLEGEKKQLHDIICFQGIKLFPEEVKCLLSIKGFSVLTATALMADVATIERFPNAKKFCCYLRSTPRVSASNQIIHLGRTNKQGRSLTCTLLTQSIVHLAKTDHLCEFKERISHGKKACVVRMAIIRKILTSAYQMLRRKQLFHWVDQESYGRKLAEYKRLQKRFEAEEAKPVARSRNAS